MAPGGFPQRFPAEPLLAGSRVPEHPTVCGAGPLCSRTRPAPGKRGCRASGCLRALASDCDMP